MSRASEAEHATSHHAASGADHAPDLDAEHSPETSRRASLSGLRREAAVQRRVADAGGSPAGSANQRKGKLSDATPAERATQHSTAVDESDEGIEAAVHLGAARIDDYTAQIHAMIGSNTNHDGGPDLAVKIMSTLFDRVGADVKRLEKDLLLLSLHGQRTLQRPVLRLGGALDRFVDAWGRAQSYASQHGDKLDKNPEWIKQDYRGMVQKVGLNPASAPDVSVDTRNDFEILKTAIQENAQAVIACARSARMGMVTGTEAVLTDDVKRLWHHVQEVHTAIRHDAGNQRAQLAKDGDVPGTIRDMITGVQALLKEIPARPALDKTLKEKDVSSMLAYLQQVLR